MEKKFNPLDLTQVSKKQLDKSKRIEEQAADFLKLHDKRLAEQAALLEKKKQEDMIAGARFAQNSAYVKNKNRAKAVQEAIGYTDRAGKSVMTDVLSTIVEGALLLDVAEYSKLNPDYRKLIKETVSSLLEKGKISKTIKNKKTLKVMDHVAKSIPDVKTGVYLKEQELIDIVRKSTPGEINNVISSLTGDVKERVANLVVKEQDDAAEINKEVDELVNGARPAEQQIVAEPVVQPAPEAEEQELPSEEELMTMQQEPGIQNPAPEFDEFGQEVEKEEKKPVSNTAVEVSPDGTVKVNIIKENFYRERPRAGVLESLAINEALDMVKAGKPYNGDLALANAIVHLTVLEAFNATGLIPINELDYARMLNIPLAEAKKKVIKPAIKAVSKEAPKAHTPEVKSAEVHKGEQKANEVKAPLIEARKSWKDKAKDALAKQEAEKPWNKKMAEEKKK